MTASPETPDFSNPENPQAEAELDVNAEIAALSAQVEELKAQAAAAREAQIRSIAEVDNIRKRAERDAAAAVKFGAEKLLGELVSICDSMDLGMEAARKPDAQLKTIFEGLDMTNRQLVSLLQKHGVTAVDPKGEPFNPDFHEAVSMVPSAEVAPNHVLNVMQKGYKLHERLLRPAMVIVARQP